MACKQLYLEDINPAQLELDRRVENVIRAQRTEIERLTSRVTELEQDNRGLKKSYGDRVSELQDMQEAVDVRERAIRAIIKQYVSLEPNGHNVMQSRAIAYAEGFIGTSLREGAKNDIRTSSSGSQNQPAGAGAVHRGGCAAA